jgi:hypothetical protein
MVYDIHIRNLKSESSQDYGQNPQRNCTFMNSASGLVGPEYWYPPDRPSQRCRPLQCGVDCGPRCSLGGSLWKE